MFVTNKFAKREKIVTVMSLIASRAQLPDEGDTLMVELGEILSNNLQELRSKLFPPNSQKELRSFSCAEAAKLIGVSDAYLRQMSLDGKGPSLETTPTGRRLYTLQQINEIRELLDVGNSARRYVKHRRDGEKLQVIAISGFKGGIGKTIHSAHLAQYLALQGYRVLAIDLDPQGSLSTMFGYHTETEVQPNESLYGTLRYDEQRVEIEEIIRESYFDGVFFVPSSIHLMEFEHATAVNRGVKGKTPFYKALRVMLDRVEENFDFVIFDCPPQLGYLTLSALCAATTVIIPCHPQMLDVSSTSQYLLMAGDLLAVFREFGVILKYDAFRFLMTRFEPTDLPQQQMDTLMRRLCGEHVLKNAMLKTTAISDSSLSKQTLYEVERTSFSRNTYDRAISAMNSVNAEIEELLLAVWGRKA
jgi:chromosome partitioning protein